MKFRINTETLPGFTQFLVMPERDDSFGYPQAHQFRGGGSMISRLIAAMTEVKDKMEEVDRDFHDPAKPEMRQHFEFGLTFSYPGSPHITVVLCARRFTMLLNGHVMVSDVHNVGGFLKALKAEQKRMDATEARALAEIEDESHSEVAHVA